jgi:hypothetical protein
MNKIYHYQEKNEIDLKALIRRLWNEKILILIFSVSCMSLFYLYTLTFTEEFKTDVIIQDPPYQVFEKYDKLFEKLERNHTKIIEDNKNERYAVSLFNHNFKLNLLSKNNLENFIQQSKETDDFKVFLKKSNISASQYFLGYRFGELKEKDKKNSNRYFLIFPKELEGPIFLNNYVEFTKNKTKVDFMNKIKMSLSILLTEYEENLVIAKQIGLENPFIKFNEIIINLPLNERSSYYFEGTKVLSQKIIFTKKLISELEANQFDYNPILDEALIISKVSHIYQPLYILGGLVFGFFSSLIIIFIRDIIKNK